MQFCAVFEGWMVRLSRRHEDRDSHEFEAEVGLSIPRDFAVRPVIDIDSDKRPWLTVGILSLNDRVDAGLLGLSGTTHHP